MGARKAVISGIPIITRLDQLRGAPESYDENVDAPIYAPDQWILEKGRDHEHALALYFMYYNFCRIHQTLRVTPAMEAGVSDHVWSLDEVIALL